MKILFLIPPSLDNKPAAERIFGCNYGIYSQPNIFILYPATILKEAGYDVQYIDFPSEGKNVEDFKALVDNFEYDIVVFYTVFLSKKTDIRARDMIHKKNHKVKFIFMATEASANPQDFVDKNSLVIRGEAESRILQVVDILQKNQPLDEVEGVSFEKNKKIVNTKGLKVIEDLDKLPFPDQSIFSSSNYHNPKLSLQPFTTMLASRGCSFHCYYCVPNSQSFAREIEYKKEHVGKPPVRVRSPRNIIMEFSQLAKSGYKSISFVDDQFVWGDKRTIEICQGIAPYHVEWSCLARADQLQNPRVALEMAKSGCKYVDLGIESFDQKILDYIGKGCKVEMFYIAIDNLKKAGIEVELNILLGACPLETKETIEKTFQEVIKLNVDYVLFSICTPFPYTEFNKIARQKKWMIKPEYEAIDPMKQSFISYPHLTKSDLEKTIRQLYFRYYFRPTYILKKIVEIQNYKDLINKARAALSIIR